MFGRFVIAGIFGVEAQAAQRAKSLGASWCRWLMLKYLSLGPVGDEAGATKVQSFSG